MEGDSQNLMLPIEIPISHQDSDRLAMLEPLLERFGFQFTAHNGLVSINSIPPLLNRSEAREFFQESLIGIKDGPDGIFTRMACKAAIKAGQKLCSDEAMELLKQWRSTPESEFCPHGRPCVLRFDAPALEKMFKRR